MELEYEEKYLIERHRSHDGDKLLSRSASEQEVSEIAGEGRSEGGAAVHLHAPAALPNTHRLVHQSANRPLSQVFALRW